MKAPTNQPKHTQRLSKHTGLFLSLGVFVFCAALSLLGVFDYLENKTFDARTKVTAKNLEFSEDIVFVVVDQESIDWAQEELGWGWPWPRNAYGDMVRYLDAGGADSVLFDILYTEPSVYGADDDERFAEACAEYGRVAHTMFVSSIGGAERVLFPVDGIRDSAALIANITSAKDSDDVIRRTRLSFAWEGGEYPSLGTAPLVLSEGPDALTGIRETAPLQKDGTAILRYRSSIDDYVQYRARDLLESWYAMEQGEEPDIEPENFENAVVYVAYYAPGLFDICSTPVSQVYPGVGVHITTYDNIIHGTFVKKCPEAVSIIYLLLSACLGLLLVLPGKRIHNQLFSVAATIVALLLAALLETGAAFALFSASVWIPLVAPLACLVLSFGASLLLQSATEGKQKRFIKSAFSQYLSPAVIENLISDPESLKLGGEKRTITIYFSDVQGFTSISEKLSPEKLTEVLNTYLSEMTDIILASGGTIDKYEGDAIIAFWNAPATQDDHGKRGIEAAMRCQARLTEMRETLEALCGKKMYQRIGLNTGDAVVGNMGSRSRFDYTMLGDSVNLASRLEGLNKQFGTYTMCSKATKEEAEKHGSTLCWRELATVAVVGKSEPVTVYEPMEPPVFEAKRNELAVFEEGRQLFYAGEFEKARLVFVKAADKDPPCRFYAEKCAQLLAAPPAHWDAVWHTNEK